MFEDLSEYLDLRTDFGCSIRQLNFKNGHHLVLKVESSAESSGKSGRPIKLPDSVVSKSVGNLRAIKGLVIRSSAPFRRKSARKTWVWDNLRDRWINNWLVKSWDAPMSSDVLVGCGIVYNSYNVGFIEASGARFPIVREIDIEAVFPAAIIHKVQVGDAVV